MMRYTTAAAAIATLVLSGSAFAQTAIEDLDRSDWPDAITVGTASQGGTYFTYGSGWANLVQEMLGISASGEVTGGPVQNATLVQTGELGFGMVTMGPAYEAWVGESELAPGMEHTDLRAMFPMYMTPFQCISLAGSGISSVSDMDGHVVGVGPAGGTPGTYWPRFLETLGVTVDARYGGASDLAGQLQDGLLDAFCFAAGLPISAFAQVEAQTEVTFFAFTEEQQAALVEAYPSVSAFTIPADTYESQPEDQLTVSMWNFAITNASLPDSLVYGIMEVVLGHHDRMMQIHRAAADTVPENYVNDSFLPFHPGAVQWYEDHGFEIPEDLRG